jgi:hypothetical protein
VGAQLMVVLAPGAWVIVAPLKELTLLGSAAITPVPVTR